MNLKCKNNCSTIKCIFSVFLRSLDEVFNSLEAGYNNKTMEDMMENSRDRFQSGGSQFQNIFQLMKVWHEEIRSKAKEFMPKVMALERNRVELTKEIEKVASKIKIGLPDLPKNETNNDQ